MSCWTCVNGIRNLNITHKQNFRTMQMKMKMKPNWHLTRGGHSKFANWLRDGIWLGMRIEMGRGRGRGRARWRWRWRGANLDRPTWLAWKHPSIRSSRHEGKSSLITKLASQGCKDVHESSMAKKKTHMHMEGRIISRCSWWFWFVHFSYISIKYLFATGIPHGFLQVPLTFAALNMLMVQA